MPGSRASCHVTGFFTYLFCTEAASLQALGNRTPLPSEEEEEDEEDLEREALLPRGGEPPDWEEDADDRDGDGGSAAAAQPARPREVATLSLPGKGVSRAAPKPFGENVAGIGRFVERSGQASRLGGVPSPSLRRPLPRPRPCRAASRSGSTTPSRRRPPGGSSGSSSAAIACAARPADHPIRRLRSRCRGGRTLTGSLSSFWHCTSLSRTELGTMWRMEQKRRTSQLDTLHCQVRCTVVCWQLGEGWALSTGYNANDAECAWTVDSFSTCVTPPGGLVFESGWGWSQDLPRGSV